MRNKNTLFQKGFIVFPILLALGLVISGATATVVVSSNSLPGQALYPVKELVERTRILLADEEEKRKLYDEFAQEKIKELRMLQQKGAGDKEIAIAVNALLKYANKLSQPNVDSTPEAVAEAGTVPEVSKEERKTQTKTILEKIIQSDNFSEKTKEAAAEVARQSSVTITQEQQNEKPNPSSAEQNANSQAISTPTPTPTTTAVQSSPTPTSTPPLPPTSTPTSTLTPTPTLTSLIVEKTVSLSPEGDFTPNASGTVTVQVLRTYDSGFIDLTISGTLKNLVPNRVYKVWLCGVSGECSTNTNPEIRTDSSGFVSFSGVTFSYNQAKYPAHKIKVYEKEKSGSVSPDFTSCFYTTVSSTPCLSGSISL